VLDNKLIMNRNKISNALKKYFLSKAESAILDCNKYISTNTTDPITYLVDVFSIRFTKMNLQYTTTHDIEKII
jgi:hypothetical protein